MRRKTAVALVALASLVIVATAVAQSFPARIDLPRGWQPEGIAAGTGNTLYVGSIPTGAVARVDARTGRTRVLVAGRNGRAATGLKFAGGRLFVAGAGTGRAWVYSASTGRQLGGFDAFRRQFSTVRSIVFSRASEVRRSDSGATVAVATTATHTDHVDHCAGTADTLPAAGGGWVVAHIAISC